jgi:hypothetical protein
LGVAGPVLVLQMLLEPLGLLQILRALQGNEGLGLGCLVRSGS